MTLDEMQEKATARVKTDNPEGKNFKVSKIYDNLMEGTLISVAFETAAGKEDFNHVYFGPNEVRTFRWHSDVLNVLAGRRERIWFFRFIALAGIGGVIAFVLVIIFSVLLCVLAFTSANVNPSILEVVKLSFSVILGYFFGSQATGRK